jgi:hypothetical protein
MKLLKNVLKNTGHWRIRTKLSEIDIDRNSKNIKEFKLKF